jgi:hypothetical protein
VKARAGEDRLMADSWALDGYDPLPKLRSLMIPRSLYLLIRISSLARSPSTLPTPSRTRAWSRSRTADTSATWNARRTYAALSTSSCGVSRPRVDVPDELGCCAEHKATSTTRLDDARVRACLSKMWCDDGRGLHSRQCARRTSAKRVDRGSSRAKPVDGFEAQRQGALACDDLSMSTVRLFGIVRAAGIARAALLFAREPRGSETSANDDDAAPRVFRVRFFR